MLAKRTLVKNTKKTMLAAGLAGGLALGVSFISFAYAAEIKLDTGARKSLAVAIYNNDLALVKDFRAVDMPAGLSDIAFVNVSAQIQPESVLANAAGVKILEQDFNFDLLSPESLLEKYVGLPIKVVSMNPATGVEKTEDAVLLSANNGTVVKIGNRIETDFKGRFVFPDIPANLRDRPTLVLKTLANAKGKKNMELSYLTSGLSWQASYVAELNADEDAFALNGWVSLSNTSGVAYENAALQLVAGEVNRVRPAMMKGRVMAMNATFDSVATGAMQEESFMDYHLYTLPRKTSILSNQTKQVALLAAPEIRVAKEYSLVNPIFLYKGLKTRRDMPFVNPEVSLKFVNDRAAGLGLPLPAGVFRVYKADQKGQVLFVGEDRVAHTPKGEEITIKLGKAFDVTAKVVLEDMKLLSEKAYQASLKITFKNAKDNDVLVNYYQDLPVGYKIISESFASKKQGAGQVLWKVAVPKNGEKILKAEIFVAE